LNPVLGASVIVHQWLMRTLVLGALLIAVKIDDPPSDSQIFHHLTCCMSNVPFFHAHVMADQIHLRSTKLGLDQRSSQ